MLPPVDFSNQTCAGGKTGILYWDGTTAIKCIPGTVGDASGNVTAAGKVSAGTVAISGAQLGALNGSDSDRLTELNSAGTCAANYALTKTAAGFACVAVTDLAGVGTVTLPACAGGQYLFWDDSTFSCPTLPAPPAAPALPPVCNGAGQALQFDGANYSCVTVGGGLEPGAQSLYLAYTARSQ